MAEREIPVDPQKMAYIRDGHAQHVLFCRRQEHELQALSECAPYEEPNTSVVELLDLKEILADAIDELTPVELFVFNACVIERRGMRVVARMLMAEGMATTFSKSGVHVALHRSLGKLRVALSDTPEVQEYLNR